MNASARRHGPAPLTIVLAALLAGCVMIPYRPPAETVRDRAEIANRESLRLSVGPRVFLDDVAKAVSRADQRVQRVDGQTFIDAASPTGELTLARLQDAATLDLVKPLQLDFVVLFAAPVDKVVDEKGFMLAYIGFFGLAKSKGSTTYWTAVLDARTLTLIEQLKSESVGTDVGIGYMYGLFVVSDTGGSARKDVVRHIVQTMAATRPTGPLRVAFLAVEPIPTPEEAAAEAQKRDLATPQWAAERYPAFVPATPPPEGQALIYVYRPERGPEGTRMDFVAGPPDTGATVSRLHGAGYFPFYVPAGDVTLRPMSWKTVSAAPVTLSAAAGGTYFVRGHTDSSLKHGLTPKAARADAERALVELQNCRLMPSARGYDIEAERRAELGDRIAAIDVWSLKTTGVTYADGQSVPADYPAAYKWSLIAQIRTGRKELEARLTPEQIAEAKQQAAEWRARTTGGKADQK